MKRTTFQDYLKARALKTTSSEYVAAMASSAKSDAPDRSEINADLRDVATQIHQEFAGRIDPREVDECLTRMAAKFENAKVRSFVPMLVRRYVTDQLQERLKPAQA